MKTRAEKVAHELQRELAAILRDEIKLLAKEFAGGEEEDKNISVFLVCITDRYRV